MYVFPIDLIVKVVSLTKPYNIIYNFFALRMFNMHKKQIKKTAHF